MLIDFLIALFHIPILGSWRLNKLLNKGLDRNQGSYFRDKRYGVSEKLARRIKLFGKKAVGPMFDQLLSLPDNDLKTDADFLGHLTDLLKFVGPEHAVQARSTLRSRIVQNDERLMIFRRTLINRLALMDDEENFRALLFLRDKVMPFEGYALNTPSDAIGIGQYILALQDEDKKVINAAISKIGCRLRLYRT